MAIQKVLKWGNSLALRMPGPLAKQLGVAEGDSVEITLEGTRLVVEAAAAEEPPAFTSADLVKALEALKSRDDGLGRPRGRELL